MSYYIVFGAEHQLQPGRPILTNTGYADGPGPTMLVWYNAAIGLFKADNAEDACKAAAKKVGKVGTFFACEGYPWGVELMDIEGVSELGGPPSAEDARDRKIRDLERQLGVGTSPVEEPT